jgi:hypothetical protein
MSRKSTSAYLENAVGVLVEHFGIGRVRSALAKVSNGMTAEPESHPRERPNKPGRQVVTSIATLLEELRQKDPEKCHLLTDFYARLRSRSVLPESQDLRHFAQLIGLKEIAGKSRNDMIPKLMRVLLERSNERLRRDIEAAANVSEQQRKQGFSVLTDKILSGTG